MRKFATLTSMLVAVSTGLIATDLAYGGPEDPGVDAQTEAPLKASEQRSEREAASAPADSPPSPAQELKGQSDDEALATATEESPELFAPGSTAPFELRPGERSPSTSHPSAPGSRTATASRKGSSSPRSRCASRTRPASWSRPSSRSRRPRTASARRPPLSRSSTRPTSATRSRSAPLCASDSRAPTTRPAPSPASRCSGPMR